MATYLLRTPIVNDLLTEDNYANWKVCVKNYLLARDLWDIVEATTKPQKPESEDQHLMKRFKSWRKKNAMALHAIQISCSPYILSLISEMDSANRAWDTLAKMFQQQIGGMNPLNQSNRGARASHSDQLVLLHKIINEGNSKEVTKFLENNRYAKFVKNPDNGMTALHVAIFAGHKEIAEELMNDMKEGDLEAQDANGVTFLCAAAHINATEIARSVVEKNRNLVRVTNRAGDIPLVVACARGHRDMTYYLYPVTVTYLEELETKEDLPDEGFHATRVLKYAIIDKMFGKSCRLIK